MVSFDVVSFFSNVPTSWALEVAKPYLTEDKELRTTLLPVDQIISLLKLCLSAIYLLFWGRCYRKIHATAMDHLFLLLLPIWKEVKYWAIGTFPDSKLLFWKRYVDDTFTAIKLFLVQKFHEHLNLINSIKFTHEVEEDGCLPFLDVMICQDEVGQLSTSVCILTSIWVLIPITLLIMKVLWYILCWNEQRESPLHWFSTHEDKQHVVKSLIMENVYPEHFIISWQHNRRHTPSSDNQPEPTAIAVADFGIKTVFRPSGSLKHTLYHPKGPLPVLLKSGVVYRIPCKDCEKSYVGQTLSWE